MTAEHCRQLQWGDFMEHNCKELLEYKKPTYGSIDEYEECINRKAQALVDSAIGTGVTLGDFFAAIDDFVEVAKKAKELAAKQTRL